MFGLAYCFIVVDSVVPHVDQYTESNINDRYHVLGFNQVRPAPPRKQDVSHIQILSQVQIRKYFVNITIHRGPRSNDKVIVIEKLSDILFCPSSDFGQLWGVSGQWRELSP